MLSILIPVYNYNITTLVQVVFQQAKNTGIIFEIIIFDDASTDKKTIQANQILNQLPYCTYIFSEKNAGRTAARNALAQYARYDLLLFMDADVLPKNDDFIEKFNIKNLKADLIFGGITYEENPPEKGQILRWKYGRAREAKPLELRKEMPYLSIISQCFLIKKEIFLKANNFLDNVYGVDVLFCLNLEKIKVEVLHVNNPVVHLGLESNISFIEKTEKGLKSLYYFEQNKLIPADYRPIQRASLKLKKYYISGIFNLGINYFQKCIIKNLCSKNPSLFLFDLYRLNYYSKLKPQTQNA